MDLHDELEIDYSKSVAVKAVIKMIMASPFPMFVLMGPTRNLIYNDAYIPILGARHPQARGRPYFEIWPEVRSVIEPVIDRAFGGQASLFEELAVTLERPRPETAWFTFSYSPVRDENDEIVAVLCVCQETTATVELGRRQKFLIALEGKLRELGEAHEIVNVAQEALGRHLGVSRVGYGSVDDTERFFTTERNWTDGSVPSHNGTHDLAAFGPEIFDALRRGVALIVDDTLTDPRTSEAASAAAFAALQVRSAATVSLIKGGRFVAALYVHHHEPRRWTNEDAALVQDVAERTWAAVERSHAEARNRQLAERRQFLLELTDRLRQIAQPNRIKAVAAEMLGRHLGVGRAGYGEIDAAEEHVSVERDWTDGSMGSLGGETRHLDVFGPGIIAQLRKGRILRLPSVADDPVSAPYAAGYDSFGTRSLVVVPLIKEGRFVAIFFLHEANPRQWSDEDVALTSEVAERTWSSVERARAESAVRELNHTLEQRVTDALAEKRLYAELVERTDSPIQMIDKDFRFLAINPAAQADYQSIFGVKPEIGQSLKDLLARHPEQQQSAVRAWSRALNGEAYEQRQWWGRSNDTRRAYETQFRPLRNEAGEVVGAYLLGRDITDLLHEQERLAVAEDHLRQAQKMESMGQLTGGVAHDFNNLLTPIVGSLSMLQSKQLGGEREQRMIARAAEAAERARVLVHRLLAFARRQPLQPTAVDAAELVNGMAALIRSTVGPQITVVVHADDGLPAARADANQLEMALLNLAVNARDAMPEGGTLRISARAAEAGESVQLTPGRYICFSVADTGLGMDEVTLKRAAEPFFSTKGIGKGTGLGLSMVHGLALQLGGALTIQSRPGVGTNVELWLPITERVSPATGSESLPSASQGEGRVLLVDDDELVRSNTSEMLRELGYEVHEAASAAGAAELMARNIAPDFLVTDHLMPGMSGTDLARSLLQLCPKLKVLIISGYSALEEIAPDLPRLSKPFRSEELAAALRALGTS